MSSQGPTPPSSQQGQGYPPAPQQGYGAPPQGYPPPAYPPAPPHPAYAQPGYPMQQGYAPVGYPPPGYAPPGYVPMPAGVTFGGFWIRVGAYLIDMLIIWLGIGIVVAIAFGGAMAAGGLSRRSSDTQILAVVVGVGIVVLYIGIFVGLWLYEAKMTSSPAGGTVGKRAVGLRIVRGSDGSQLTFGRATGRFFAKAFITGMVPLGIGFMMAGFTERKRALHDMIADTVVIRR